MLKNIQSFQEFLNEQSQNSEPINEAKNFTEYLVFTWTPGSLDDSKIWSWTNKRAFKDKFMPIMVSNQGMLSVAYDGNPATKKELIDHVEGQFPKAKFSSEGSYK